jgi:dolichol-phosphate mannosyltransferase
MGVADCFVSVVAPLHNQAAIVEGYISETIAVLSEQYDYYEFILVDDGSSDGTVQAVERMLERFECIRLIILSRNYGEEIAISAGLDSAIGDYVVVMLPETDPPGLIPEIVELARMGNGMVFGIRSSRQRQPLWARLGARFFYWYCQRVLKLDITTNSTHYRVFSRQAVNAITQIRDRYRYLRIFSSFVGYTRQSFEYEPINRSGQTSPRSLLESINLAIDITVANSKHPLRLVSGLGLFASILNLLYVGYIILVNIFKNDVVEGWTTSSLQSAGMFFFILLILTVLSEYIGRILEETRERPLYYVEGEKNSSVMLAHPETRNIVTEAGKTPVE